MSSTGRDRKLLVVDVGNTQTHFGVFAPGADAVEQHWRFATVRESTADAVRSGIVYGFAGQVDGIVARLREELGADTPVIATGGLAHHLVPSFTESIDAVDDLLTLDGLRLIWELNR